MNNQTLDHENDESFARRINEEVELSLKTIKDYRIKIDLILKKLSIRDFLLIQKFSRLVKSFFETLNSDIEIYQNNLNELHQVSFKDESMTRDMSFRKEALLQKVDSFLLEVDSVLDMFNDPCFSKTD